MNLRPPIDDRARAREVAPKKTSGPTLVPLRSPEEEYTGIRRMIWLYFWLLLLEGALRKWFLPGLANPLLVVRDPVVIVMYFMAISAGIFPWNSFVSWLIGLAIVSTLTSFFAEHGNILVTMFGLRTNFLHLPLIFLMPKVFNLKDVEKIGKWMMISAIPMALLVAIQFRSSPNAWVNVGVGGSEGAQLTVGFGKIRPPGTFSFTSGFATYMSLLVAYVISWQLRPGTIHSRIALTALPAAALMVAISCSRGVLVSVVVIVAGVLFACFRQNVYVAKGMRAAAVIAIACFFLQFRSEVRMGLTIHEDRVTTGGGVRFGLIERTFSGFLEPFQVIQETPLFGAGIGLGTTAAGGLLFGERSFLLAETEWLRVMKESGPIVGLAYLTLRVVLVIFIAMRANRALDDENPLPIILFFAMFPVILTGQFGVPTMLGFACFGGGLCLAAANLPRADNEESGLFRISPESVTNPTRMVRGRSIYAEKLHGR